VTLKTRRFGVLGSLAAAALLAACGTTSSSSNSGGSTSGASSGQPFKVAWIYNGSPSDAGWTAAQDAGRKYVVAHLGSKVQTTYKENVPEGPQAKQVIESLIRQGNKLIFATSFGFQPSMVAEAASHPEVMFEQATGSVVSKNLAEYYGAGEDSIYLAGMAAGAASKKGVLGYVSPFAIPEVIRDIDAFTLGAQATHPGAKVRIVWTNTWFDPATESKAAQSLVSAGADVLGQGQDSPATGQVAKTDGLKWTGYDSNQVRFAPASWLTAAVYNWGPYYLRRVEAAMNGTWKTGNYYGGLKDGFTNIAPFGQSVPAGIRNEIVAQRAALIAGKYYEFQGPLYDQTGKLRVPAGKRLSLSDILGQSRFVNGVIGKPTTA
jgi:basic membrane protein A and related proteins